MAKALQCPNCGTKKRLDGLDADTFRCEQCGQVLKVPPAARRPAEPAPARAGGAPAPPPRRAGGLAATVAPSSVVAPPPPRRSAAAPVAAAGGTAVLGPRDAPPVVVPPPASRAASGAPEPRAALPLPVRILAWVVAIPIGLAVVGIPARKLGYLTSQKLLDVFVKHTLARFVPLAVIVVLWALATAILVELFVEGGRWLMLRRRRRRAGADQTDDADADADAGGAPPPGPPPRRRRARRG